MNRLLLPHGSRGRFVFCLLYALVITFAAARGQLGQEEDKESSKVGKPSSSSSLARIVGGWDASPTRYPYFCLIQVVRANGRGSICGGSLIHVDLVLTAAHCGVDATEFVVALNYTSNDGTNNRGRAVERAVLHPQYDEITEYHDVMVLQLFSPVRHIAPVRYDGGGIPLPQGTPLKTMGMGSLRVGGDFPENLQEVSISILNFTECNDQNSYAGGLDNSLQFCAGTVDGSRVSTPLALLLVVLFPVCLLRPLLTNPLVSCCFSLSHTHTHME